MKNHELQIMFHASHIGDYDVRLKDNDWKITSIVRPPNNNYLFLYVKIDDRAKAGKHIIAFENKNTRHSFKINYELKERNRVNRGNRITGQDVIYLLMPDRFANGNPENDDMEGMLEKANRNNPNGRHGGDLKGVIRHLDYFKKLGVTTLWLNPVLENNQPEYSYHGYAITDFYRVDSRLGSNELYRQLVETAHQKGLKIIMDMVFNHCGSNHWWMNDLPWPHWINQWPAFTRSNYRAGTFTDPHASEWDKTLMKKGWFDKNMPDLNTEDTVLAMYLIQNTIWWIEFANLDGLRVDTYPYPNGDFMLKWAQRIFEEYPEFSVIGEAWLNYPASVAFYQKDSPNSMHFNSGIKMLFDFPLYFAISQAFVEEDSWDKGLLRLYEILSQDFLYAYPDQLVIMTDNHDLTRVFSRLGEDLNKWKMAMTFLMTTRGIPLIYYGTEILMTGFEHEGHGFIRKDFPGGWQDDSADAFQQLNLTTMEVDAWNYLHKLIDIRKKHPALQSGKLIHFIPENHMYVYFRVNNDETLMIILNKNEVESQLDLHRYEEFTGKFSRALDLLSGETRALDSIVCKPHTGIILKLLP